MISPAFTVPELHPREKERLQALRSLQVLDTKPEERYDRITRLAIDIFHVPIAYISLVDANRQWFKSTQGVTMCETAREVSFCGHAILGDDTLVINDASKDPRFAKNPLVLGEPYVRFYAGRPLRGNDDLPIGTICLVDRKPREFGDNEQRMLKELGLLVENELKLVDTIQTQEKLIHTQVQLLASQDHLRRELGAAARYVRSLLPKPLKDNRVQVDWHFQPSEQLGGDAFHYYWLDSNTFVFFLLDVAGHGLEAALLSVSVLDTLRNQNLGGVDFTNPGQVLKGLNRLFAMSSHANKYFTLWYGVYSAQERKLEYSSGGHPQAILQLALSRRKFDLLGQPGHLVGAFHDVGFENYSRQIDPDDRLYVFSDGLYEAADVKGDRWSVEDLASFLVSQNENMTPKDIVETVRSNREISAFQDDVSLLELNFK